MLGKLAVVGVVGVFVMTIVGKVQQARARNAPVVEKAEEATEFGFVMLKPEEAKDWSVHILAPLNCPRPHAVRARDLAEALNTAGIPHQIQDTIEFSPKDQKAAERIQKFMSSAPDPVVFIRGRAKGNPSIETVIAEFRAPLKK